MGNSYYEIECTDEELGIFVVRKRPRMGFKHRRLLSHIKGRWKMVA
jgi:hypothetical protein